MLDKVVAIREGIRSENETRGCGESDIDVNDDNVAPWYRGWVFASDASERGMSDVRTATGWAVSRRSSRSLWWCSCAIEYARQLVESSTDESRVDAMYNTVLEVAD